MGDFQMSYLRLVISICLYKIYDFLMFYLRLVSDLDISHYLSGCSWALSSVSVSDLDISH